MAHLEYPRTGLRADTGSNLENRSPPAAHRPFLGKERGRGRREAAPISARQLAWQKPPVDTEGGPQPSCPQERGSGQAHLPTSPHRCQNSTTLTRILQGALAGVVAHAIHTGAPIGTCVLHTVVRIHLTGRSFKASGTGTPEVGGGVVAGEERRTGGQGQGSSLPEALWKPVSTCDHHHPRALVPTPGQARARHWG